MTYHLCPEAWRIYDLWSKALDAKSPDAASLRREFNQHRRACAECDKPKRLYVYSDCDSLEGNDAKKGD